MDDRTTFGRDEMNLAEFPIGTLAARKGAAIEFSDVIRDKSNGQKVSRKLTVVGDGLLGLPTTVDEDVVVALIHETKRANDFSDRVVPLRRGEILSLMRWHRNGKSFDRLDESLRKWVGVTLRYERAWWRNDVKEWSDATFHILDNVNLEGAASWFAWNIVLFDSFRADNVKRLDCSAYFSLALPSSRRAYRFLDKRFYHSPSLSLDLETFACQKVGFRPEPYPSRLKAALGPTLAELEASGFLLPDPSRYSRGADGRWTIRLARRPVESPSPLVAALTAKGVARPVAEALAAEFPDRVGPQIRALGKTKGVANPAAYLVASIRGNYETAPPPPPKVAAADHDQRLQAYWDSLSPGEQAAVDAASIAAASEEHLLHEDGPIKNMMQRRRRLDYIRDRLGG